jgi:signal transduction histidine kinase
MVVASALLALVVGAAFFVLLRAVHEERDSAERARGSQAALAAADRLERLVVDVETGQRGFVITGRERFLDPWRGARRQLPGAGTDLVALAGVPAQRRRARRIVEQIDAYVREYSVPLVRATRAGDPAVRGVAATDEGRRRIDAIRGAFTGFIAAEQRLSAAERESSQSDSRRAIVAATVGLAGSILLIVAFAAYLFRGIVLPIRRAAAMATRLAGGDLSVRMPETGVGEIGELERAFNTMGRSLQSSRDELAASRARVVAAGDETRRRIERDLHDGTQQRLVSLGLELRAAEATVPPGHDELRRRLAHAASGLAGALEDLQEISRGIHPVILSRGGLGPALRTLARRSAVPVTLDVRGDGRLSEPVEAAAYYVVSEALTNAAKHAGGSEVHVDVDAAGTELRLSVRDDGAGGARFGAGSGLIGLRDRVEALDGTLELDSPEGGGTTVRAAIPIGAGEEP